MRIVTLVKQVPDLSYPRAFNERGWEVRGADDTLNEVDENAIEAALRLAEQARAAGEEVTVAALTMGPAHAVEVLRRAKAMGVDELFHLQDEALAGSDAPGTAAALAGAIKRLEAEVVVAGLAALDGLGAVVPSLVAAELGWAQLTCADSVQWASPGIVRAQRDLPQGDDVQEAALPVVVSVTDVANHPRLVRAKDVLAARAAEVTTWVAADLDLPADAPVGGAKARAQVVSAAPLPARATEVVWDDGAGSGARDILRFLAQQSTSSPPPAPQGQGRPVLVWVADGAQPSTATADLLANAHSLGPVTVLTYRAGPALWSAQEVREVQAPVAARHAPSTVAQALVAAAAQAKAGAILLASNFPNKEIAAHTAHRGEAGLLVDIRELRWQGERLQGSKPAFAATWRTSGTVPAEVAVVVLAPGTLPAPAPGTPVVGAPVAVDPDQSVSALVEFEPPAPRDGLALAEAEIVVAAGRGTDGDFAVVRELAELWGAAVGTTRDAVEEGWLGHDHQVGQTGVTVAPRIYLGAGISGAPHHLGGMSGAQSIIAINTDPDAPLMQQADLAVVGDLHIVLRALVDQLRVDQLRAAR